MSHFTHKQDLTRWNRAGLERFRYVDGNAVTYLETLREAMKQAFTAAGINQWQDLDALIPVDPEETPTQREARWQQQYRDDRRDYAWEILRSYARSAHILMEHCNAYANENFLRTATEWENVRRLVEMIDYHPSPPASAETVLAMQVKETMAGKVEAGFAVKNKPSDGSKPVVFETLQDIEVSDSLNLLRSKDWNKSQRIFTVNTAAKTAIFPLAEPVQNISVGTLGVLQITTLSGQKRGFAITVTALTQNELHLKIKSSLSGLPSTIYDHQVSLYLKPESKREPQLRGQGVIELSDDHGLSVGAVIAWTVYGSWRVAKVLQVEGTRVRLSSNTVPAQGEALYLTAFSLRTQHEINGTLRTGIIAPAHLDNLRYYPASWNGDLQQVSDSHSHYDYDFFSNPSYEKLYYIPKHDPVATVVNSNISALTFDGKAKKLVSGDWLIAARDDNPHILTLSQIAEIREQSNQFELITSNALGVVDSVHTQFSLELVPADADKNLTPVFLTAPQWRSANYSVIALEGEIPELLEKNRTLVLQGRDTAINVNVKAVDHDLGHLIVTPAIEGSEPGGPNISSNWSRYYTRIMANAVAVGHGETQKKKNLGSGDATKSHQQFHLDIDNISFVRDALFATGVKADLTIQVNNREYTQVASLKDSDAEDPHYTVRMREDTTLEITFGDGKYGRRLPSGNNNVSVVYRTGTGLAGNVSANSLVKAVKPHYLIDSVEQPVLASGGNDMESAESMRAHAPASVLTLERCVSLQDFVNLTESNSSVWQAAARMEKPGKARTEKINVAIVPAGGGDLGTLSDTIKQTLDKHSLPGVLVNIIRYQAVLIHLNLIVNVKTEEFDIELVELAVREALLQKLSLANAGLGKNIYRSQVLQIIESVEGVENCQAHIPNTFFDENNVGVVPASVSFSSHGHVKRITPGWQQAVYLHPHLSMINLTMQTFSP